MNNLKTKHLLRTSFILGFLLFTFKVSAIDTKRFDAPPLARPEYLTFSQPQELRYKSTAPSVDRRKLLLPSDMKIVTVTVVSSNDTNSSANSQPGFPLIGNEDNRSSSQPAYRPLSASPLSNPNPVLPLSDPFGGMNTSSVNSTDELLQVFETPDFDTSRSRMQNIPFVPPYAVTPDSMRMTNRATYRRIQR
ncbi:hypothetical protein N9N41_05520 [Opitutales bacterium]|nr:hypothetical protein [Opitutales bacterium]